VSVKAKRWRGNITAGVLVAGLLSGIGYGAYQLLNPPPTAQEVATIVAGDIAGDSDLAAYEGVGAQFLQAYLTFAATEEDQKALDTVVADLSGGEGARWRATNTGSEPAPQKVLGAPTLVMPLQPSPTTPGAITGLYRIFVEQPGQAPAVAHYSVTMGTDERGLATVVGPPGYINVTLPEAVANEGVFDSNLASEASPAIIEFLKVWSQVGPDAPAETQTQLQAWLSADASGFARAGLDGAFTFNALRGVQLAPLQPGARSTDGLVTVEWLDAQGRLFTQRYAITVTAADNGTIQVSNIGPA